MSSEKNIVELFKGGTGIDKRSIFFIEFTEKDRDLKKVHFADFRLNSSEIKGVINWRTRLSAKRIIEVLGDEFFIQIHQRYIINKFQICARKSNWKEIQISFFLGAIGNKVFLTNSINIGKSFLPGIKKYTRDRYVELKDKEGDIFFINPMDIVYFEITKEIKTVYFDCIYPDIGNKLEWESRLSSSEIIKKLRIEGFFKIHRRYVINRNFPFKADSNCRFVFLCARRTKTNLTLKPLPVGMKYKSVIYSIIS